MERGDIIVHHTILDVLYAYAPTALVLSKCLKIFVESHFSKKD
nr:MAG TPA: hypothetical protein [Caudoviricetes sp.]